MLLNSVIILLREVLEASLLISVLLFYSHYFKRSNIWLFIALLIGLVGAVIYGHHMAQVSDLFAGVGQEVMNALLHILIYILILLFILTGRFSNAGGGYGSALLMMFIVMMITMREGSEIYAYLQGFAFSEQLKTVLFGALIGTGIGMSVGIFAYYFLVNLSGTYSLTIGVFVLILEAGSMVSQAVQLLMQADWVEQTYPLWDSSHLLSETSITGQLFYALMGYEATPTPIQVVWYLASMAVLVFGYIYQSNSKIKR